MTKPVCSTPNHIRASITRSVGRRGRRAITSSVCGSTPMASAGAASVIRLIHKICVASSGSSSAPLASIKPRALAPSTARSTVSTSPMLDDSR
ncbi:hypothetical protein D3C81_1986610 [compost metagenome]